MEVKRATGISRWFMGNSSNRKPYSPALCRAPSRYFFSVGEMILPSSAIPGIKKAKQERASLVIFCRIRAISFPSSGSGAYPIFLAIATTFRRVVWDTPGRPRKARETAIRLTPARFAISCKETKPDAFILTA